MQHSKEAANAKHTVLFTQREKFSAAAPPRNAAFQNKLLMLRGTNTDSSLRGKVPGIAQVECSPTIQTISPTQLWLQEHKEATIVHFSEYIWDSYTPIENVSPFIPSSSSLQGCGIKYHNRSLPEKTSISILMLLNVDYKNTSGGFFKVSETFS